jgi:hypothetical protein
MTVVAAVNVCEATVITYTTSGNFLVPGGVTSINVLAIGGGGGGANGHQGGGGAGYLSVGTFAVNPGDILAVIVGSGGTGALSSNGTNDILGLTPGGTSSLGGFIFAAGGQVVTGINQNGQNGSSGGGGAGNGGFGGAGGSGGSNGFPGATYPGGLGQGSYIASLSLFTESVITPGLGGAAGVSSHSGGGGGGGILINGLGPTAGSGLAVFSAFGGVGYGAGGGAGGFNGGSLRAGGGNGADGLVYIEFQSGLVPEPSSFVTMLGCSAVCFVGKLVRRRKANAAA